MIEFSDSRLTCLKSIPAQLEQFSIGDAKEADIRAGFDCMGDALLYFNKRTFGSVENGYTVEEMRRFFGKYFLKENNVSPEFAGELMKIKKALLGGSTEHITKDEVVRLIEILKVTRDEAVELAPHMKILLSAKDQKKADWDKITAAVAQLRRGLLRLLEKLKLLNQNTVLKMLKKLFQDLLILFAAERPLRLIIYIANGCPWLNLLKMYYWVRVLTLWICHNGVPA